MTADPRAWQGGMEADDRSSYGVGGHQNWVGQDSTDIAKQGYYQSYGVESADRGGYYTDHAHGLSGDIASCEQSLYGSAQVVPIGPSPTMYDTIPHQHFTSGPSAEMEHWHIQMLSQTDPFIALPIRDGPTKRKRRRVISVEQRKAANIRERRRMYQLNEAFDGLRKRVPTFAYEKKLSRIETLKLAVTYIEFMTDLLDNNGEKCKKLLESAKNKDKDGADKSMVDDDLTRLSDNSGPVVGQSPSQSVGSKQSCDTSEDELCDS